MSERREVSAEMTPETALVWQVISDGETKNYYGFGELRSMMALRPGTHKGLIVVEDEDVIRFFVYDKTYEHSVTEFIRYWEDVTYRKPVYRKLDYSIKGW